MPRTKKVGKKTESDDSKRKVIYFGEKNKDLKQYLESQNDSASSIVIKAMREYLNPVTNQEILNEVDELKKELRQLKDIILSGSIGIQLASSSNNMAVVEQEEETERLDNSILLALNSDDDFVI